MASVSRRLVLAGVRARPFRAGIATVAFRTALNSGARVSGRAAQPWRNELWHVGLRLSSTGTGSSSPEAKNVVGKAWSFEEIKSLKSKPKKPTLIDVREKKELEETGRIPGAVNIPITSSPDSFHIDEQEFEERFGFPRPRLGDELVFYCRSGVRCHTAAVLARDAGFGAVGEYSGSFLEWVSKGGEVER